MDKVINKILIFTVMIAAIALVMTGCDNSKNNSEKLVFGTNAEFPPFEFHSSKGIVSNFDGIDIAIAKNITEAIGKTIEISNMEFDSILIALQNGQIDAAIAGLTVTDERAEAVDFSKPYYNATQVMIVKEGSDIKKAADMDGKTIAVVHGYTGQTCIKKLGFEKSMVSFKTGTECVMELLNGKCEVVVIDSATAKNYIAENKGLVIVEDNEAFQSEKYAIAVKKGNQELLNKINAAIDSMNASNTIELIATRYL